MRDGLNVPPRLAPFLLPRVCATILAMASEHLQHLVAAQVALGASTAELANEGSGCE